jgi:CheY-like chemotaxis protein
LLETLLPCLSGILRIDIAQEPDVEGLPLRRMEDRVGITVEVAEPDAIQPHLASSTSRIELLKENVTALQNAGYDVAAFTDSMTAMDALLTSSPIELLITRVRFPDNTPNGVALGRMARIKRPGIKVLFTSFPDGHEHIDGVGEYLPRPFSQEELLAVVGRMLDQ